MTTLNQTQLDLAARLAQAKKANQALDWEAHKEDVNSVETAYLVQEKYYEQAFDGQPVGGYKVSLTSEKTQKLFDSDCPLYGVNSADNFKASPCELDLNDWNEPLVECELVFTALEDLSVNDSLEDLLQKVTVAPGLEVPDSRFAKWFPALTKYLVVSDAAVGGCVVFGKEHKCSELFANVDDLTKVEMKLYHNGEQVAEGVSTEVLGNPLNTVKWLVSKLHEQGKVFKKGQRVSSGTFNFPPSLSAGEWKVEYTKVGECVLNVKPKK